MDRFEALKVLKSEAYDDDETEITDEPIDLEFVKANLRMDTNKFLNDSPENTQFMGGFKQARIDIMKDAEKCRLMSVESLALRNADFILGYLDGISATFLLMSDKDN